MVSKKWNKMKNKPSSQLFKWNHDCLSSLQAELSMNKKTSQSGLQFQENTHEMTKFMRGSIPTGLIIISSALN